MSTLPHLAPDRNLGKESTRLCALILFDNNAFTGCRYADECCIVAFIFPTVLWLNQLPSILQQDIGERAILLKQENVFVLIKADCSRGFTSNLAELQIRKHRPVYPGLISSQCYEWFPARRKAIRESRMECHAGDRRHDFVLSQTVESKRHCY